MSFDLEENRFRLCDLFYYDYSASLEDVVGHFAFNPGPAFFLYYFRKNYFSYLFWEHYQHRSMMRIPQGCDSATLQ